MQNVSAVDSCFFFLGRYLAKRKKNLRINRILWKIKSCNKRSKPITRSEAMHLLKITFLRGSGTQKSPDFLKKNFLH